MSHYEDPKGVNYMTMETPYADIIARRTRANKIGMFQIQIKLGWSPAFIGEDTSCPMLVKRYDSISLGEEIFIRRVHSFIGWDRGDVGEAGIVIYDKYGQNIYDRSHHKEGGIHRVRFLWWESVKIGAVEYDAIHSRAAAALTDEISIHLDAWPTGINIDKHTMIPQARVDFHIVLYCEPVKEPPK